MKENNPGFGDKMPIPNKPQRMELTQARELLEKASAVEPSEIHSLEDLSRFGNLTEALIVVGEHLLLSNPNTEFHDGIALQQGATLALNWQEESGIEHRFILQYPSPELPLPQVMAIQLESPQDFMNYVSNYTPGEIGINSHMGNQPPDFIMDYKIGNISGQRQETVNAISLINEGKFSSFNLDNTSLYKEDTFIDMAKGIVKTASILSRWIDGSGNRLSEPTNPPILPNN